ncbi:MAG: hypothetical protein AB9919_05905 [Geobacteraceae bacterium]
MAVQFAGHIYLQESEDLLNAIREIQRICRTEHIAVGKFLVQWVILARMVETLLLEGMDSAIYLRLARSAPIQRIIRRRSALKGFTEVCKVFPIEPFQGIYQPETYLNKEAWETFINQPALFGHCRQLIDTYISRWINGEHLEEYNREPEIGFPLYNLPDSEWVHLLEALPALIFSLHFLTTTGKDEGAIHTLMVSKPVDARPHDAPTLWLQRKAAELLYDAKGLTVFLPYDPRIRQMLIAFIAMKKKLPRITRKKLAQSILEGYGKFDDSYEESIKFILSGD